MDVKTHWEKVYTTKAGESVSWYRAHLETSLALIERAAVALSSSIIDIGGGESTLVDDLLLRGYKPRSRGVRTSTASGGCGDDKSSAANGALRLSVVAVKSGREFRLSNPSCKYPTT